MSNFNFQDSNSKHHVKHHHSVATSHSDDSIDKTDNIDKLDKVDDLEKEVNNLRWFLHQMYEEQERLKEENKKQKRAIHKLVNNEKRKHHRVSH
jgi:hypothetical protein